MKRNEGIQDEGILFKQVKHYSSNQLLSIKNHKRNDRIPDTTLAYQEVG